MLNHSQLTCLGYSRTFWWANGWIRLKLDKFWGEPSNSGGCTFAYKILRYFWTIFKFALERVLRFLFQPTNKESLQRLFKKVFIHRFHQTSRRTGKLFKFKLIWSLKMVLLVNTLCEYVISHPFSTTQILNSQKGIGNRNFVRGNRMLTQDLRAALQLHGLPGDASTK